ncbi:MAG: S8 family serine peptidase [Phycisphaeraceae bacterium]|nr:S8 family serine peptidase [Phycisphaeraceae bacterium]
MSMRREQAEGTMWDGAFETLESRVLLAAGQSSAPFGTGYMTWHGITVEVVRDQWLLTFNDRNGDPVQRASQVAAALGVRAEQIEGIGRGRWAKFITHDHVTETAVAQVMGGGIFSFLGGVEPDTVYRPTLLSNDARLAEQWAIQNTGQFIPGSGLGTPGADISASSAWNITTGSRQVLIAVIDTGIDLVHPDLAANLWTNPGEIPNNGIDDDGNGFIDDVRGWDFGNNDNNPTATVQEDHGVAVSGVIGAVGNNGIGVAGINWQVTMIPIKGSTDAEGTFPNSATIAALDYLTMMRTQFGFDIVASNNSYGALRPDNFDFFDTAAETAIREFTDSGALFVASAGNDGNNNDGATRAFPASYDNEYIISVAATDNIDGLADFSNYGLTTVDVGAPGVRVLTTAINGGYQFIDGTSFSAPYTAGVIALMKSVSPFADKTRLRNALYASVDQISSLAGKTVTGGRINANEAVRSIGFPGPVVLDINPGLASSPVDTITIGFSKALNPAFLTPAAVELRAANGDGDFNANDAFFSFSASDMSLNGSVLTITIPSGSLPIDKYRLTLFAAYLRDFTGNYLNGTTAGGNDQEYEFSIVNSGGPYEPNDTIGQATPLILNSANTVTITEAVIGDGPNPTRDVDLYRLVLGSSGLLTITIAARNLPSPSTLDSFLRLFDASGRELARNDNFDGIDSRIQFFVPAGGKYYIGVSGYGNSTYQPSAAGSGPLGQSTGTYNLTVGVTPAQSDTATYPSIGGAITLPTQGEINATIFVPDIRLVQDLNVRINIAHSYVGDLQIRLISPSGRVIPLVINRGGPSALGFVNTVFDDNAGTSIVNAGAPWTGSFRPEGTLADVNNQSAAGMWTLRISDTRPLNNGTLLNWALLFTLENSISGPFEFNDTLATATDTGFTGAGTKTYNAAVGDGAYGQRDVDLFRVVVPAGSTVTAAITIPAQLSNGSANALDSVLRIFDQQGNQLQVDDRPDANTALITFPVTFAGTYYIGVSGAGNLGYLPDQGGSGLPTAGSGEYTLKISILGGLTDGSVLLAGNALTVGIASDGTFGSAAGGDGPTGINLGGNELLVPEDDLASIESYYGATFNTFVFRNAGTSGSDVPVKVSNESDFSNRRVLVEGLFRTPLPSSDQGGGLLVRRAVSFAGAGQFMVVDLTLVNTTFSDLTGVTWVEGFRPQQAGNLGSDFTRTVNNVDNATHRLATASYYNNEYPGGLTIGLGAAAPDEGDLYVAAKPAGSVRDASQVIDNPTDPDPSGTDLGVEGDATLALAYDVGTLAPGARVQLRYFIFTGGSLEEVKAQFAALDTGTGTGFLVENPIDETIAAETLPYSLYYPEGYANDRASTFVPITNPHAEPVRVVVTARYENPALAPKVLLDGIVAGNSRDGITISTPAMYAAGETMVEKDTPYALEIKSSLPIGAMLSHYDFGIATGQAFTSQPSTVWTFSEGTKGSGVNDFLVYYNTSEIATKVTLTIFLEGSSQKFVSIQEAGPQRRLGWDLGSLPFIPTGSYAMRLDSEQPIVAALSHFDPALKGGFSILGLPSTGSTVGVSPEGQIGRNAENEIITILNTTNTQSAVTFTFYFDDQSAYRTTLNVPAGQRSDFNVGELPSFPKTGRPYSVGYESTQPVTVSMASYAFGSATGTRFTDQAQSVWLFGDGFKPGIGSAVTEYLRIFNPTSADATVEITLDFAEVPALGNLPAIAAGSITVRKQIVARAANDIDVHSLITGARATRDLFYSIRVASPTPVVVYTGHFDAFFGSGFGTLGTALGSIAPAIA